MRRRLLTAPLSSLLLASVLALAMAAGSAAPPPVLAQGTGAGGEEETTTWLVVLEDAPVAALFASAPDAAAGAASSDRDALGLVATSSQARVLARDAELASAQARLADAIEASGARVLASYRAALNALLVEASLSRISSIAALPGVRGVWRAPMVTAEAGLATGGAVRDALRVVRPTTEDRYPLGPLKAPREVSDDHSAYSRREPLTPAGISETRLTQDPPTLDGSGTIVAVAGSGVDYLHTALGGDGDATAFADNDPTQVEAGSFPTAKVVGGYDLAGPIYSAACPDPVPADELCSATPQPDDDPLDAAGGLGTSLAGIVAGDATGAGLVALDIFGSPEGVAATSALQIGAIDWVVRHNSGLAVPGTAPAGTIDVLLLQAGAAWGGGAPLLDEVVRAASEAGVTVVAPVGDTGDVPFAATAPSTARAALAVGAAYGADDTTWGIRADWEADTGPEHLETEAVEAQDPWPTLSATGAISGTLAWYGLACNDDMDQPSLPAQDVNEKIALVERGDCTFAEKVTNAEAMGAVAALLFTDQRGKTSPRGGAAPGIPSLMIDRAPGQRLRQLVEDGRVVTVLLDPDYEISLAGLLLPSSGRGPSRHGGLTPDVVADGANVGAPSAGGGDATRTVNGTAPAAARVAGLAAKVAQWRDDQDADWEPGLLGSMIAQSTEPGVRLAGGEPAPVARQGAGLVDVDAAPDVADWVSLHVTSPGQHGPIDFDWGAPRLVGPQGETLAAPLAIEPATTDPIRLLAGAWARIGVVDTFSGTLLTEVALGEIAGRTELDMVLDVEPSALPPWTLDDGRAVSDEERLSAATLDGHFVILETDENERWVEDGARRVLPFQVTPRAGACVASGIPATLRIEEPGASTPVRADNACAGEGPIVISRLAGVDPAESTSSQDFPGALDIVAVGLRYGQEPPEDPAAEPNPRAATWIEVHVQTELRRRFAPEAAIDVLLDLDRDGAVDRILTTVHAPDWRGGYGAGDWRVLNTPPIPGTMEPDVTRALPDPPRLVWDLDEGVTVLRFRAEETLIDLESGEEAFDFAVRLRDAYGDYPIKEGYPGADLVPDGAADGAMLGFDQARHECLSVLGPDGTALDRVGSALRLPGGSDAAQHIVTLGEGCPADADYGLLYSFPRDRDVAGRVVEVEVGGETRLYLPWSGALAE